MTSEVAPSGPPAVGFGVAGGRVRGSEQPKQSGFVGSAWREGALVCTHACEYS